MSNRDRYSVIKGVTPRDARALIEVGIKACPGAPPNNSKWSDWQYEPQPTTFHCVACPDALVLVDDAYRLAQEMAKASELPHLELRVQEGDHWDFTLLHRSEVVADFSTRVAYFDFEGGSPRPWKKGSEAAFVECWNAPATKVTPYLIDWDALTEPRLVRTGDRFRTGDYNQVFDFMQAIGIASPYGHPDRFEVVAPMWQGGYRTQPWWRRVVRRISVKIKGTYPDVPRRTKEEEAAWERRAASVKIVKWSNED